MPWSASAWLGSPAAAADKIVSGYLASWKAAADKNVIPRLPADRLTHIYLAFGEISASGDVRIADPCSWVGRCPDGRQPHTPGGIFAQMMRLKASHPHLRILISFGGWNGSKYFSRVAATPSSRERFARSILRIYFRPYRKLFDGIDIDWEYPVSGGLEDNLHSPQDSENFPKLMAALRKQLDRLSAATTRRYELAMAVSADTEKIRDLKLTRLLRSVDWITVMTYDYFAGANVTGFNAPLFGSEGDQRRQANIDATVKAYLQAGVPRDRIVLGLPFYGRAYGGVPNVNDGLFQRANPLGARGWGGGNGIDFRDLIARRPFAQGFRRRWHATSKVPWLYNPTKKVWISYDDVRSIKRKAVYVRSQRLAGVAIWELSADNEMLFPAVIGGLQSSVKSER